MNAVKLRVGTLVITFESELMKMKHFALMASFVTLVICLLVTACFGAGSGYHVVKTYKLGGEGGWDYLTIDPTSRHLFISRATHVIVIDADSGKLVGNIPDTPSVHGIALAPEFGRGFISNGREGTVSIFDLKTLKTLNKVKAGDNPDAILYDPSSKRVFAFNGHSHDATAIDAEKGTVAGTVKLDGKPEFAVSDEKGEVFVNIEDKSELTVIDPKKLEAKSTWPLKPCEEPSGLAIDRKNRRLFAGCDNKLMAVVDADNGKVITTLPIGEGVDANGFDPDTGYAFASCGEGVLTVAHEDSPDKFSVVENVPTERGARTMALDPKTQEIFLVTAKFGPRPQPSAENPRARPPILPDSFVVLVVGK
ncbi:MAG: YVTN family beta-propeller domain-containing protein [Acidobacteria bacterium]|nr:MAG: YVTN family beta-propeller domain-containing protein [Acidobacteriota bacterium]